MPYGIPYNQPQPQPVNRHQQKFGMDAIQRRLQGISDPRGLQGMMSRGKTIYPGNTYAAQSGGGPQYGRPVGSGDASPRASAIQRRIAQRKKNRVSSSRGYLYGY